MKPTRLLLHFCRLVVPPGARVKRQMTMSEVKKTKEAANLRIHIERTINKTIFFRILKGFIPMAMIQNVHELY